MIKPTLKRTLSYLNPLAKTRMEELSDRLEENVNIVLKWSREGRPEMHGMWSRSIWWRLSKTVARDLIINPSEFAIAHHVEKLPKLKVSAKKLRSTAAVLQWETGHSAEAILEWRKNRIIDIDAQIASMVIDDTDNDDMRYANPALVEVLNDEKEVIEKWSSDEMSNTPEELVKTYNDNIVSAYNEVVKKYNDGVDKAVNEISYTAGKRASRLMFAWASMGAMLTGASIVSMTAAVFVPALTVLHIFVLFFIISVVTSTTVYFQAEYWGTRYRLMNHNLNYRDVLLGLAIHGVVRQLNSFEQWTQNYPLLHGTSLIRVTPQLNYQDIEELNVVHRETGIPVVMATYIKTTRNVALGKSVEEGGLSPNNRFVGRVAVPHDNTVVMMEIGLEQHGYVTVLILSPERPEDILDFPALIRESVMPLLDDELWNIGLPEVESGVKPCVVEIDGAIGTIASEEAVRSLPFYVGPKIAGHGELALAELEKAVSYTGVQLALEHARANRQGLAFTRQTPLILRFDAKDLTDPEGKYTGRDQAEQLRGVADYLVAKMGGGSIQINGLTDEHGSMGGHTLETVIDSLSKRKELNLIISANVAGNTPGFDITRLVKNVMAIMKSEDKKALRRLNVGLTIDQEHTSTADAVEILEQLARTMYYSGVKPSTLVLVDGKFKELTPELKAKIRELRDRYGLEGFQSVGEGNDADVDTMELELRGRDNADVARRTQALRDRLHGLYRMVVLNLKGKMTRHGSAGEGEFSFGALLDELGRYITRQPLTRGDWGNVGREMAQMSLNAIRGIESNDSINDAFWHDLIPVLQKVLEKDVLGLDALYSQSKILKSFARTNPTAEKIAADLEVFLKSPSSSGFKAEHKILLIQVINIETLMQRGDKSGIREAMFNEFIDELLGEALLSQLPGIGKPNARGEMVDRKKMDESGETDRLKKMLVAFAQPREDEEPLVQFMKWRMGLPVVREGEILKEITTKKVNGARKIRELRERMEAERINDIKKKLIAQLGDLSAKAEDRYSGRFAVRFTIEEQAVLLRLLTMAPDLGVELTTRQITLKKRLEADSVLVGYFGEPPDVTHEQFKEAIRNRIIAKTNAIDSSPVQMAIALGVIPDLLVEDFKKGLLEEVKDVTMPMTIDTFRALLAAG
jgi:hypothetical protein